MCKYFCPPMTIESWLLRWHIFRATFLFFRNFNYVSSEGLLRTMNEILVKTYLYIYIYMRTWRPLQPSGGHICIYIYMHTYIYAFIYIHITCKSVVGITEVSQILPEGNPLGSTKQILSGLCMAVGGIYI